MARKSTFGSLSVLASGSVRARYRGPDLAYHPRTFPLLDDADNKRQRTANATKRANDWLDAERRLIDTDKWTPPKSRSSVTMSADLETLRQYAERWLKRRRAGELGRPMSPNTVANYRSHLDNYVDPTGRETEAKHADGYASTAFHNVRIDHVSPGLVDEWYSTLPADKPTTRAQAYSFLRTVMTAAVRDRSLPGIEVNPCQVHGAGSVHVSEREHEPVTLSVEEIHELADLLAKERPERRALVYVSALACLRFGEARALQRRDIDLKKGIITVREGVIRDDELPEEERTDGAYVRSTTKSGKKRQVPIGTRWGGILATHLETHAQPGRDGLVFPGASGNFLRREALWGDEPREKDGKIVGGSGFRRARVELGYPDAHWHDLRHSGATLFAQNRATVRELMELLGHSTPEVAMRYQHVAAGRMASIAGLVDAAMWPEDSPALQVVGA